MTLPEIPFMASTPAGSDVLFKGAEEHLAGRVLLTGYNGDRLWATDAKDLSQHIVRVDDSGVALTEYRLWVGFIHCPLPFWGARQIRDIQAISNSPEMSPWNVGPPSYRRPICRRIVEEAGVPRELFGVRKLGVSELIYHAGAVSDASLQRRLSGLAQGTPAGMDTARAHCTPARGRALVWIGGWTLLNVPSAWLLRRINWPIRGWWRVRAPLYWV